MKIQKLPQDVVTQIAAGETIERPSSIVKELVENSLDAGATEVEVDVEQGGRYLKIVDNGRGIPKSELLLALEKNATSKIRKSADLWKISSFGFRGEALASIAAVSRLTIISRSDKAKRASRVQATFGKVGKIEDLAGSQGTTLIIEDLFAEVPARLKFLKSDKAEIAQIKKTLKAFALANPKVDFRVRQGGKLLLFWQKKRSYIERVKSVLDLSGELFEAKGKEERIKTHCLFSSPAETSGNTQNIWLFAQGRWIQDRTLIAAVMEGYRNLLMHGEYPFAVIFLTCPPDEIDVNIHPAKAQIKFQDARSAFRVVHHTLRGTLETAPWLEGKKSPKTYSGATRTSPAAPSPPTFEQIKLAGAGAGGASFERVQHHTKKFLPAEIATPEREYKPTGIDEPMPLDESAITPYWGQLQVLGQANLTYILAQSPHALILVDQHAAHERVAFERLNEKWRGGEIEVQKKLIPLTVDLEDEEVEALLSQREDLQKFGVAIDQLGPNSIGVTEAPTLLSEKALIKAIHKIVEEVLRQGESFSLDKITKDLLATMACHSVVRAGQAMSREEMESLLKQMDEYPLSSFCPHGRPVFAEYSFSHLDREFGRIV
jgi:DNA mismatch repair protein MutL